MDVDDVAELILGVVGDTNRCLVSIYTYPFVGFIVFEVGGISEIGHNSVSPFLGAIMSFNKILRIAEHPRRADKSAMCAINRVHDKSAPTVSGVFCSCS